MGPHLHLLGILQLVWGAIGLLLGVSTLHARGRRRRDRLDRAGSRVAAGVTAGRVCRVRLALLAGGGANAWAGWRCGAGSPHGRIAVLALAVPNLFVLPFGTALGIYAFWVLLHNETAKDVLAERGTDGRAEKTASGLDANLAAALAYALGWVSGLVFLLTEHDNKFVRFHAMQSVRRVRHAQRVLVRARLDPVPRLAARDFRPHSRFRRPLAAADVQGLPG